MSRQIKGNAGVAAFAGVLLAAFGFLQSITAVADHGPVYDFLISLFNWTLRVGGLALIAVAVICFLGHPVGLLLDSIVSSITGFSLLTCAVGWFSFEKSFDITTMIAGVVAVMLLRDAFANWSQFRSLGASMPPVRTPPPAPAPIRISSEVLADGAPPPDGYLAALAKEKDEPPSATFE